jgi:hypothetical protein
MDEVYECVDEQTGVKRDVLGIQACFERDIERQTDA